MSSLYRALILVVLAFSPVLSWFFVITAPFILSAMLALGIPVLMVMKLETWALASGKQLQRLEALLRNHVAQLGSKVKVCGCVFVKESKTYMAAQFEDGKKIWNYWVQADTFGDALTQLQGTLATAGSCAPSCANGSCAGSPDCPYGKRGLAYKRLKFAAV